MKTKFALSVLIVILLFAGAGMWLLSPARGYTRIDLENGTTGKTIAAAVLRDGEKIVLTWRNSLFDLDVTECFYAENGKLIQDGVRFADPRGLPPPEATAREVEDLYHTGGPFTAKGLDRPFSRIVYRVSEVGTPKMELCNRIVDFKQEVGFGGAVVLTTSHPRRFELFSH
jgi:hypothetical protein